MIVSLENRKIADLRTLTSASPEDQEAMRGVTQLLLAGNRIADLTTSVQIDGGLRVSRSVFSAMAVLTVIDLSRNELRSLEGLSAVRNSLEVLDVSCNFLTSLHGIESCTRLSTLRARRNQLESLSGLPEVRSSHPNQPLRDVHSHTLTIDVECNNISRILDILDEPLVLESLVELNIAENPLPLATQVPAVAERCLQPELRFIVGGTHQERVTVRKLVGRHVTIDSPFDTANSRDLPVPNARPPMQPPTRSPSSVDDDSASISTVESREGTIPPQPTAAAASIPTNRSQTRESDQSEPSEARPQQHHPSIDDEEARQSRSAVLAMYMDMPDREVVAHLVFTRDENAKLDKRNRELNRKLKEFKRLVSDDVARVRELKESVHERDEEIVRLREKLRKRTVENEGLKGQLEAARDGETSSRLRSKFFQKENDILESHIQIGGSSRELSKLRDLVQQQQVHIDMLSEENDTLTDRLKSMSDKVLMQSAESSVVEDDIQRGQFVRLGSGHADVMSLETSPGSPPTLHSSSLPSPSASKQRSRHY